SLNVKKFKAVDLVEITAGAIEHGIGIFVALLRLWPVVLTDIGGLGVNALIAARTFLRSLSRLAMSSAFNSKRSTSALFSLHISSRAASSLSLGSICASVWRP